MMVYLSECKFGDKLKTKNGRMALLIGNGCAGALFTCIVKADGCDFLSMFYYTNGEVFNRVFGDKYDIVGKWEDEK